MIHRRSPVEYATGRPSASLATAQFQAAVLAAAPGLFSLSRETSAIGVLALVLLPTMAMWLITHPRRLLVTDPILVIGFMWILAVSMPVLVPHFWTGLYRDPLWTKLSPWSQDEAALWMYRSWAACSVAYFGYRAFSSLNWGTRTRPDYLRLEDTLRIAVGVLGLTASAMFLIQTGGQAYSHLDGFSLNSTLDQIIHEVRQLSKLYIFLYFHSRSRQRSLKIERRLLFATLVVYAFIFTASSSKLVVLEIIAMWVLGNAAGSSRGALVRELVVGAAALLMIYCTFYFVTAYRQELVLNPPKPNANVAEVFGTHIDAIAVAAGALIEGKQLGSHDHQYDAGSMFDRLAYIASMAQVLDVTNGSSPYDNAFESFLAPLYAMLPRDLLDDKVQFMDSGAFAKLLGSPTGGFSISFPGSLFWAWGYEGIVPGMMALGLLIAVSASNSDIGGAAGLIWRTLELRLVLGLLDVGNEFQSLLIGCVRTMLFVAVLYVIVAALQRRPVASRL